MISKVCCLVLLLWVNCLLPAHSASVSISVVDLELCAELESPCGQPGGPSSQRECCEEIRRTSSGSASTITYKCCNLTLPLALGLGLGIPILVFGILGIVFCSILCCFCCFRKSNSTRQPKIRTHSLGPDPDPDPDTKF